MDMGRSAATLTSRETVSAYDSTTFKNSMTIRIEQPVGAMSISPSGRDIVLASKDGLHIIDLDNPFNPPRFLRHLSSWEVADVQWSPFAARDYWVISTSNQKALVWNLNRPAGSAVETVLHGHSRAITDINFSAHHPDHLATCGVDSFVHIWDMKAPRRPALSFSDWFAGATQVKYNRQDEHVIASSHDKLLHIWDKRNGAYPLQTIEAHDTKIYGIDWNRTRKTGIVTCSLDKAIKFWDYSDTSACPERVLYTNYPVWRARHTPFGWGIMAMPQRGDNDLYLYDRRAQGDGQVEPVTKFSYHSEPVKEFLWRSRGGADSDKDDREFQLVTWSKDRNIRLWEIPLKLMKGIGHDPESKLRFRLTRLGARYRTFRREPPATAEEHKSYLQHRTSALVDMPQRAVSHMQLRLNVGGSRLQPTALKIAPGISQHGWTKSFMSGQRSSSQKTTLHRDMNPIQWMKGIKMQNRGDGVFGLGGISDDEGEDIDTINNEPYGPFPLEMKPTFGWTGPETLSDEITLVGLRFPKIRFEKVNIATRNCLVSFNGPWGADSAWVFLRCAIQFPASYPDKGAAPVFQIDRTTRISDEQLEDIYKQLKRIADSHLAHHQFCLEACLSYLLGERAEDAMYWANKRGHEAQEDDSSTDDDLGSALTRGPESDILKQLVKKNNKGSVPLAKACGAMWSETGMLVCFFPPKEDQPQKSLLSILNMSERLQNSYPERFSKRLFESFGRLQNLNPMGQRIKSSGVTENDSADDAEAVSSSSLDSSSASDELLRSRIQWKTRLETLSGTLKGRNPSTDRSTQKSGGTSQMKSSINVGKFDNTFGQSFAGRRRQRNYLALHDYSDLLPSKHELAEAYAIYGLGAEVCEHNARVAQEQGYLHVRDAWKLSELILCRDIPLQLMSELSGKDPMLVVAPDMPQPPSEASSSNGQDEFFGRVKWGNHPCGQWLVRTLFSHFENCFDPQMLAMMACVFLEPEVKSSFTSATLHLSQQEMPISLKSPGFSLDYYPSFITALRRTDSFPLSPQHMSGTNTPLVNYPSSYSSSLGENANALWQNNSGDLIPHSISGTPPMPSNLNPRLQGEFSGAQSISSSPEQHSHHPLLHTQTKRTTGISNFTGGIARALTNAQGNFGAVISGGLNGINSSPPSKKPKPISPDTGSLANRAGSYQVPVTTTWAPETQTQARMKSRVEVDNKDKPQDGDYDDTREDGYTIDLQLFNLENFDDEGSMSVPLLNQQKTRTYRHYRETYADMLYTWDLPLERLEILKFNGLKALTEASLEKLDSFPRQRHELWDGLDIGRCCLQCGTSLNWANGANSDCKKCRRGRQTLMCVICNTIIKGIYTPCLFCGHIYHPQCHLDWYKGEDRACPSGCGCMACASDVDLGVSQLQFDGI